MNIARKALLGLSCDRSHLQFPKRDMEMAHMNAGGDTVPGVKYLMIMSK